MGDPVDPPPWTFEGYWPETFLNNCQLGKASKTKIGNPENIIFSYISYSFEFLKIHFINHKCNTPYTSAI